MKWVDGVLWTTRGNVNVYQCGSCRSYDDPDHWSFQWDHYRSCGHLTEDATKEAAEQHVIDMALSMIEDAMSARGFRRADLEKAK
jgi:hypothetical protein